MLTKQHQQPYDAFDQTTHQTEFLEQKTELLVGLAAAMAMNCQPCSGYYLKQAKKAQVSQGEVAEVLAKVMAVAAGQKRLQAQQALKDYKIDLESFTR